jgi:hypothetical protein
MTTRAAPFVDRHFGTIVAMIASLFGGYMAGQTEQKEKIESLQIAVAGLQMKGERADRDIAELRQDLNEKERGR